MLNSCRQKTVRGQSRLLPQVDTLERMLDTDFAEQLRAIAPTLIGHLNRFRESRVLVVGDLTVDEFLTGQIERVSREAPVLILRHESTRQTPWGHR
jgi:hypothetical protein